VHHIELHLNDLMRMHSEETIGRSRYTGVKIVRPIVATSSEGAPQEKDASVGWARMGLATTEGLPNRGLILACKEAENKWEAHAALTSTSPSPALTESR